MIAIYVFCDDNGEPCRGAHKLEGLSASEANFLWYILRNFLSDMELCVVFSILISVCVTQDCFISLKVGSGDQTKGLLYLQTEQLHIISAVQRGNSREVERILELDVDPGLSLNDVSLAYYPSFPQLCIFAGCAHL